MRKNTQLSFKTVQVYFVILVKINPKPVKLIEAITSVFGHSRLKTNKIKTTRPVTLKFVNRIVLR